MLVMPILVKSSQDESINKIYNVKVTLDKNLADKDKNITFLKGIGESDILLNGSTFSSTKYIDDVESIIRFIRNYNYQLNTSHFLVTTKYNNDSNTYDVYKVANIPRKVSSGLDNLYGECVKDLKDETPEHITPKYLDLKAIDFDRHITEDKLEVLKSVMGSNQPMDRKMRLMQLNGVSSLYNTIEYMNNFDFEVINDSIINEEELKNVINSFKNINSNTKALRDYYAIAINNREVYKKLNRISKIVNNKPLAIIKNNPNHKVLQKRPEE